MRMTPRITLVAVALFTLLYGICASADTFNVRDYGAQGDKQANDAAAIQGAIDACASAGGGTVLLPPGNYRSGPLELKSFVTMHLEAGATLWGTPKQEDYGEHRQLIRATDVESIAIEGHGVIYGRGDEDLGRRPGVAYEPRPEFRTSLIVLTDCRNVSIRDITLRRSDGWALDMIRCQDVVIDGIDLLNNYFRTNSDGIDPVSCRNVMISNCNIVAGDDCICLKAADGVPCENVVITNCVLESVATAIKLGTQSEGDFRDITISNCVVRNSTVGIGFFVKDGGTIERVNCSNIVIETLEDPSLVNKERLRNMIYPIYFDVEQRTQESPVGAIRDVLFQNIQIYSDNGVLIQGMEKSLIQNLALRDVLFRVNRAFDYAEKEKHAGGQSNPDDDRITVFARKPAYLTLAHVDGLSLDNVRVVMAEGVQEAVNRSAIYLENVHDATLHAIQRRSTSKSSDAAVIQARDCRNLFLNGSRAVAGDRVFLDLQGEGTTGVSLAGNDLSAAQQAIRRSSEVPESTVVER